MFTLAINMKVLPMIFTTEKKALSRKEEGKG